MWETTANVGIIEAGYVWHGDLLVPAPRIESPEVCADSRWYDAFQVPGLFARFANLTDKDSIAAFACEYGSLFGLYDPVSFERWRQEIDLMRDCIDLWNAIQAEDEEGLARLVHLDSDGNIHWEKRLERRLGLPRTLEEAAGVAGSRRYTEGTVFDMARLAIALAMEGGMDAPPNARPYWEDGRFCLRIEVSTLMEALRFQLADAIGNHRLFRECQFCGKLFEAGVDMRADAEFCSKNCRVKHVYHRKAKARQMRQAGHSLREIAAAVGVRGKSVKENMAQVKKWVEGVK